jgi:hypothetical protein
MLLNVDSDSPVALTMSTVRSLFSYLFITDNFSSNVTAFLCFLHLQPFLSQLGLLIFSIALKMNELRSTSTGLASSTLFHTLILVRCYHLVCAPHSHAITVHGDCKITIQFSHGFFSLNRAIAKTRKVRSRITRDACSVQTKLQLSWNANKTTAHACVILHCMRFYHTRSSMLQFIPLICLCSCNSFI